jgi:hypothetical protein
VFQQLEGTIEKTGLPRALQFRNQLLDFVKNESLKAQPNERLLGSSEIIDSVLGKTKRLEQD